MRVDVGLAMMIAAMAAPPAVWAEDRFPEAYAAEPAAAPGEPPDRVESAAPVVELAPVADLERWRSEERGKPRLLLEGSSADGDLSVTISPRFRIGE